MCSRYPARWHVVAVAIAVALAGVGCVSARAAADLSRRLFDFTPISADNPVVATIDDAIAIPLSELRAYRDAERQQVITGGPAVTVQRRAILDDLISEYLRVDAAHREGVPASPAFRRQMEATETMMLTDFLASRLPPAPGTVDPTVALAQQLYEATDIRISNEAFALVQQTARAIDHARATAPKAPTDAGDRLDAQLQALVQHITEAPLATYSGRVISVRQVLALYAGLPPPRPKLTEPEGLLTMLQPLIWPNLLADEARRRGIADETAFGQKRVQNQNALLRFYQQDRIDHLANTRLASDDREAELRAWHAAHRSDYAPPKEQADKTPPPFEAVRTRVLADYSVALRDQLLAEQARTLRLGRRIVIDDAALAQL